MNADQDLASEAGFDSLDFVSDLVVVSEEDLDSEPVFFEAPPLPPLA